MIENSVYIDTKYIANITILANTKVVSEMKIYTVYEGCFQAIRT